MKYDVCAIYYGSKYLGEVEAESKAEAEKLADKLASERDDLQVTLCHQCADEIELSYDPEIQVTKQ